MIRHAHPSERAVVCEMMARYVARTPYAKVLPDVPAHSGMLFDLAATWGCNLVDSEEGELVGAIVIVCSTYMGANLAEEVGWWHRSPRGALRLAQVAERHAVQIGADVLKMSAPAWTSLGSFYRSTGFDEVETVWTKVLTHGLAGHRGSAGEGGVGLRRGEARAAAAATEARRRHPR